MKTEAGQRRQQTPETGSEGFIRIQKPLTFSDDLGVSGYQNIPVC